jgi:hypothetical protein
MLELVLSVGCSVVSAAEEEDDMAMCDDDDVKDDFVVEWVEIVVLIVEVIVLARMEEDDDLADEGAEEEEDEMWRERGVLLLGKNGAKAEVLLILVVRTMARLMNLQSSIIKLCTFFNGKLIVNTQ